MNESSPRATTVPSVPSVRTPLARSLVSRPPPLFDLLVDDCERRRRPRRRRPGRARARAPRAIYPRVRSIDVLHREETQMSITSIYVCTHTVVYGNQGHLRVQKKTPACCAETSRFRATSSRQTSRGRSVVRDGRRRERERGPARRDDGRRSVDVVGTIDADVRGCDSRETRRSRGERARARGKRARGEDAGRGDDASNVIERRGEDRDE